MTEEISKSLQRYYDKRDIINEQQKKYFREVYYYKNRQKLLEYQRIRRQLGKSIHPKCIRYLMDPHPITTPHVVIIEKKVMVSF
jgi:hypothetical protein